MSIIYDNLKIKVFNKVYKLGYFLASLQRSFSWSWRLVNPFVLPAVLSFIDSFFFFLEHNTTQQLSEDITKRSRHTGVVFLGIEKAFDKINQEELLYKLLYAGLPKGLLHLTASYITINIEYSSFFFRISCFRLLVSSREFGGGHVPKSTKN